MPITSSYLSGIIFGTFVGAAAALTVYLYTRPKQRLRDTAGKLRKTASDSANCLPSGSDVDSMPVPTTTKTDAGSASDSMPNLKQVPSTTNKRPSNVSSTADSIEDLLSQKLVIDDLLDDSNDNHPAPSPSSDSQASTTDSGKGASPHDNTPVLAPPPPPAGSDVDLTTAAAVNPGYDFEVPKDIVGLLIGTKGVTVKKLMEESGAYIIIRPHLFSDQHKICSIEGNREQINACLRQIRRRFPPSRFPELKLTPFIPPALLPDSTSPVTGANVVQLSFPDSLRMEVLVSSLVTSGHMFLQQPTHPTFPSLARLDQYMLAVYGQPVGAPTLPKPFEVNVVCVAPVLGGWYRAQIVELFPETDEVLVRFVDYGGYGRACGSDLRQIRSDFMTLPFQAIECTLAHVEPKNMAAGWTRESLSLVENITSNKVVEAIAVGNSPEDGLPMVELYCQSEGKMMSVNQLLVDRGFASWIRRDKSPTKIPKG